jgi:hypothetical protein
VIQRFGAAAGGVQRPHRHRRQRLDHRVVDGQAVQSAENRLVVAQPQLDPGPGEHRVQPLLVPTFPLPREPRSGQVRQRRATPQTQCLPEQRRPHTLVAAAVTGLPHEPAEAMQVDLISIDVQQVSTGPALQPHHLTVGLSAAGEQATDPHHVPVQGVAGRGRRRLVPYAVHQGVHVHRATGVDDQRREHRPLFRPPQRHQPVCRPQLHRAKHLNLRHAFPRDCPGGESITTR